MQTDATLTQQLHRSYLRAVFATDFAGNTFRVSDPLDWNGAHDEWEKLDTARRAGETPQFLFYEVRTVTLGPDRPIVGPEVRSHDRYDRAPLAFVALVVPGRGYGKAEDAARVAWKWYAPAFREHHGYIARPNVSSDQGRGGWFYWPNGQTAAQGLRSLAELCKQKLFIVQGGDGRWYVNRNVKSEEA